MKAVYTLTLIILLVLTAQETLNLNQGTMTWSIGEKFAETSPPSLDPETLEEGVRTNPTRGTLCRTISVETDKDSYRIGEEVLVTVRFIHLKPGCVEIMMLHHHEIRLEIFDAEGENIAKWIWKTQKDFTETIGWKPKKTGVYTIRASSWFNGEELEVEDMKEIKIVDDSLERIDASLYLAAVGVAIAAGVILTYILLRRPNIG